MRRVLYIIMCIAAFASSSCSNDDEPKIAVENPDDNFITAFSLSKDGETYDAVIAENKIMVTVPNTVNLDGATVRVEASESATIMPDPKTVSNWNSERQFRVVSYNKASNIYVYTIVRADIVEDSDVVLASQADLDAFAAKCVNKIGGNLVIGGTDGDDHVKSLLALETLKEVGGTITICEDCLLEDLTGLNNVTQCGGLTVKNDRIKWLMFENLKTVAGDVSISSDGLATVNLDALEQVSGMFRIIDCDYSGLSLLSLPKLDKAGGFEFVGIPFTLESINLPELETVDGDFVLSSTNVFQPIGSSFTYNEKLTHIDGLDKLQRIGGALKISELPVFDRLPDLKKIEIGGLDLFRMDAMPETLDLRNVRFVMMGEQPPYINLHTTSVKEIVGDGDLDCDLIYQSLNTSPTLTGIRSIGSLVLRNSGVNSVEYAFEKIHRDLYINTVDGTVSFPNLKETGGYVYINGRADLDFPKLETVGGKLFVPFATRKWNFPQLTTVCASPMKAYTLDVLGEVPQNWDNGFGLYINLNDNDTFVLDKLATVGEGLYINLYYSSKPWTTFGLPSLASVGGTLCLTSQPNKDNRLTSFDFPSLLNCKKVDISAFGRLADYTTFAPLFTNGAIATDECWTVSRCRYNPTYEDMKAGRYKQN